MKSQPAINVNADPIVRKQRQPALGWREECRLISIVMLQAAETLKAPPARAGRDNKWKRRHFQLETVRVMRANKRSAARFYFVNDGSSTLEMFCAALGLNIEAVRDGVRARIQDAMWLRRERAEKEAGL